MSFPRITVVVPVYNRGGAVKDTVDSALAQDLPHEQVEIVVVNDGSTDDTWNVLQRLYENNSRVRLFTKSNGGMARSRNFGLEQAHGEFIAYLDHDDLWLPSKLRLQLGLMSDSNVGVAYCQWRDIDDTGHDLGTLTPGDAGPFPEGDVFEQLWRTNFIVSMSVPLLRTALVKQVGGFRPQFVPCDDLDLWFRLSTVCEFAAVRQPLVSYRRHAKQQSSNNRRMVRSTVRLLWHHLRRHRQFALKHPKIIWHTATLKAFYLTQAQYDEAKDAIVASNWKTAKRALKRGLIRVPYLLLIPQWLYLFKRLATKDARPF